MLFLLLLGALLLGSNVYSFLESLASLESRSLAGRANHLLLSSGVDAGLLASLTNLESTEASDRNLVAAYESFFDS